MAKAGNHPSRRPPTYPRAQILSRVPALANAIRYGGVPLMVAAGTTAYATLAARHVPDALAVMGGLSALGLIAIPLERVTGGLFRRSPRRLAFDGFFTILMIGLEAACVTFAPPLFARLSALLGFAPSSSLWPHALPFALQILLGLVIADFLAWAVHFLQHRQGESALWRMHSVHHSIDSLDLIGGTLNHPYDVLTAASTSMVILMLGGGAEVYAVVVMLNLFFNTIHHVNVDLEVGPFERVFMMPRAHAWHHGQWLESHVNFGHVLSIWDILFGTYWCPRPFEGTFGLDTPHPIPIAVPAMLVAGASKRHYARYTQAGQPARSASTAIPTNKICPFV
jgi:sterol desaturase/sphingolipid hydroxylase (fatty acid hydroxylase superfamily)